jgi:uncharacterized protein
MSLNRFVPEIEPEGIAAPNDVTAASHPDYAGLVRFLVVPFLELPEQIKVDAEIAPARSRVLVRLAFEASDKGRVFGRGGRNIQAIRTVLEGVAKASGHSAYLDVFGSSREGAPDEAGAGQTRPQVRRSAAPKAAPKLRPKSVE